VGAPIQARALEYAERPQVQYGVALLHPYLRSFMRLCFGRVVMRFVCFGTGGIALIGSVVMCLSMG
jgi:hypothetical protein